MSKMTSERAPARTRLIKLLQQSHAGEKAAAYAYNGHARASRNPEEKASIFQIEKDEWEHRADVHEMLTALGSKPSAPREFIMGVVGKVLGTACFIAGWYFPMWGAGRLERMNVMEYYKAACLATDCGESHLIEPLLVMAENEWDHEEYFRAKVMSHRFQRYWGVWAAPEPKPLIRRRFAEHTRMPEA